MSEIIRTENMAKVFTDGKKAHTVLRDVNLSIEKGDIFGIIGYSGAGKSTLVRCFNGIEKPTRGNVFFEDRSIVGLKASELRTIRRKIGMIFQQFNLMPSRTVFDNIALPLKHSGLTKKETSKRIKELLQLVSLPDKEDSYPAQLSGGQKQRVAIARALVNQPKVLLCDEATSALDPKTTKSILYLLKKLNEELGLTIVVITHEMSVVREICHKVAVLDKGKILEEGDVYTVFSNPQEKLTQSFIETTSTLGNVKELIKANSPVVKLQPGQLLLKISYSADSVSEPLISYISRQYNVDADIIAGDVQILSDHPLGGLIIILSGQKTDIDHATHYLEKKHVAIEVLNHG
ncbi:MULTISPECIES: methionine ABC transporter ATP-binding protein [unclassified Sporolactobacillus]|uniref:methionine ABC transporter ATP-binding protein n=1 Tax=unclassified Sporolactobacillus TaxID=2628533 RepID=UPI0023686489|nr:ATP-binding cassette domain-containing protein [Sporolactobacillus sp. CQH2019]MDD9147498.1 ATP-binding cassette domain-containing protein [Sporolactobacillus sp. CQH2019]